MCERGDLLLVPFPFTDLSATKRRPVLVLTNADSYGDFIALPVTSRPQAEHGLPIEVADMVSGQLPAPSWIRTNRIVTLNRTLVLKTVGRISDPPVIAAVSRFCAYLGAYIVGDEILSYFRKYRDNAIVSLLNGSSAPDD
jgi:mRNA interferase MazF